MCREKRKDKIVYDYPPRERFPANFEEYKKYTEEHKDERLCPKPKVVNGKIVLAGWVLREIK